MIAPSSIDAEASARPSVVLWAIWSNIVAGINLALMVFISLANLAEKPEHYLKFRIRPGHYPCRDLGERAGGGTLQDGRVLSFG